MERHHNLYFMDAPHSELPGVVGYVAQDSESVEHGAGRVERFHTAHAALVHRTRSSHGLGTTTASPPTAGGRGSCSPRNETLCGLLGVSDRSVGSGELLRRVGCGRKRSCQAGRARTPKPGDGVTAAGWSDAPHPKCREEARRRVAAGLV